MGSNNSKTNTKTAVVTKNNVNIFSNADPRSPTSEFTRTPLQNKMGSKNNITKNVNLRKTFENKQDKEELIHYNPILSPVIINHLQTYDPRSPSQDFERTPITIASKVDELTHDNKIIMRLQNENCASPVLTDSYEESDNSVETRKTYSKVLVPLNLYEFFDMSLNHTLEENEAPLCSSTECTENIEGNIPNINCQSSDQPTQFLETNFECAEDITDKFEGSKEKINSHNNIDKTEDDIECIPDLNILDQDPLSPAIGIVRTPIVVPKIIIDTSDDNVEDMSDDILMKVLQDHNAELCPSLAKSYDERLLIYEDDCLVLNDTHKKNTLNINNMSRPPLSCMKNKATHKRHIPKHKSLSKESDVLQSGSSISLKFLTKNVSVDGDCENTPPQPNCDLWDENNSFVL